MDYDNFRERLSCQCESFFIGWRQVFYKWREVTQGLRQSILFYLTDHLDMTIVVDRDVKNQN